MQPRSRVQPLSQPRDRALFWLGTLVLAGMLALSVSVSAFASSSDKVVKREQDGTVFLSGPFVSVSEDIDGDLIATGENISIGHKSEIEGNATLTARAVALEGEVDGDLDIRAVNALINGEVNGDVHFKGAHLTLGPDAEVKGNVSYYASSVADIDPGAEVEGEVSRIGDVGGVQSWADKEWRDHSWNERDDWSFQEKVWRGGSLDLTPPGYGMSLASAIFFAIFAGIAVWLRPNFARSLRMSVEESVFASVGLGLGWFFILPVATVFAAITIIGLPVAFLLAVLWPLGMMAGIASAIATISAFLTKPLHLDDATLTGRLVAVGLAAIVLWLGVSLPILGGLVWFAAMVLGFGALALTARRKLDTI